MKVNLSGDKQSEQLPTEYSKFSPTMHERDKRRLSEVRRNYKYKKRATEKFEKVHFECHENNNFKYRNIYLII